MKRQPTYHMNSSKHWLLRRSQNRLNLFENQMKKMEPMLRVTKENVQGTNSDAKETGTQINGVDQKDERNIQPEKNEETRIRKNEERLRNFQDILKRSNSEL